MSLPSLVASEGLQSNVWRKFARWFSRKETGSCRLARPFRDALDRSSSGSLTVSAFSVGWKKQSAGAAVAVDFVQSSGLVLASSRVLSLEALQMDLCLLKGSKHSPNGSVTSVPR